MLGLRPLLPDVVHDLVLPLSGNIRIREDHCNQDVQYCNYVLGNNFRYSRYENGGNGFLSLPADG
jgi:hypothetical protein